MNWLEEVAKVKKKRKRWTQADTDAAMKKIKEEKENNNSLESTLSRGYTKGPYKRSARQEEKILTGSKTLTPAQRRRRNTEAKESKKPIPEHLTRVKLTPAQRRSRKQNKKQREKEKKENEEKLARARAGFPEKTREQEERSRDRKDLESDLKTKLPFVSSGDAGLGMSEAGVKERTAAEIKIRREHKERKAYAKRHSHARYQKWLKELDEEDRSMKERGETEQKKEKKTKKKKPKTQHAADQEAEYKRLLAESGNIRGKPVRAISTHQGRRDEAKRKKEEAQEEPEQPEEKTDPIEEIPDMEEHEDDERGDLDKSLWKSWLAEKDATSKDEDECPFCDKPRTGSLADRQQASLFRWLKSSDNEKEYEARRAGIKRIKAKHEKDPAQFHKEHHFDDMPLLDRNTEQNKLDPQIQDKYKAEEGIGGMLMGANRGLGHEEGNKQGSGQSAQVTEVVDKIQPAGEQINQKIQEKIESMSKSAYENHEQDESPETKPNKQQIPASKPGMDTFKSLFKKSLVIKYNNLYKPLNT